MTVMNPKINSLLALGELHEAESLLFKTAETMTSGASELLESGDHGGALNAFRNVIELMRVYYNDSIDFAELKLSVSEICVLQEDFPSAISELSEAVTIMENILGHEHRSVKDAQSKLLRMRTELNSLPLSS